MSFFTKSVCEALKEFPAVNASIDGTDVVYHGFYDIGIAVSTERGLVEEASLGHTQAASWDQISPVSSK